MEQCRKFYLKQIHEDEGKDRTKYLPCRQWSCPFCRPYLIAEVRSRAIRGILQYLNDNELTEETFAVKVLHLTVPGRDFRDPEDSLIYRPKYHGKVSRSEAFKIIMQYWKKLREALKKDPKFSEFVFFGTVEPHQDGYPHLHVLLVGRGVIPKNILKKVKRLWHGKYRMGQRIQIEKINYGVEAGVCYVLKYITKAERMFPPNVRRHFSTHHLLPPPQKYDSPWTPYEFGFNSAGGLKPLWEAQDVTDQVSCGGGGL